MFSGTLPRRHPEGDALVRRMRSLPSHWCCEAAAILPSERRRYSSPIPSGKTQPRDHSACLLVFQARWGVLILQSRTTGQQSRLRSTRPQFQNLSKTPRTGCILRKPSPRRPNSSRRSRSSLAETVASLKPKQIALNILKPGNKPSFERFPAASKAASQKT